VVRIGIDCVAVAGDQVAVGASTSANGPRS
jgi:hypothetical protein